VSQRAPGRYDEDKKFPLSAENEHRFSGQLARSPVRKRTDLLSSFLAVQYFDS